MTMVNFYEETADELLKFAVIITMYQGKWVFCKHRERETLEIPGGHREPGEAALAAAKRELYSAFIIIEEAERRGVIQAG